MDKTVKFIFLCIPALCTLVSTTAANTITQKQEFSGLSGGYHNLTFNKFSDADGTLTSVEVIFSLTITGGKLILDNDGDDTVTGTLEFGYDAEITTADVSLPGSAITNNVFYKRGFYLTGNAGDGLGDYDPAPSDGWQYEGSSKNGSAAGYVDNAFYGGYSGGGNYNITVCLVTRFECGESGDLEYRTVEYAGPDGYVEVIYNYVPTPEPATIILLCTGGALVILGSKKIK